MIRKILAVGVVLALYACEHSKPDKRDSVLPIKQSDPYFDHYELKLNSLLTKAKGSSYSIKTPIIFGEKLPKTVLARCWRSKEQSSTNYIEVNREILEELLDRDVLKEKQFGKTEEVPQSEKWLLAVLLHEIGHCDFYLDHDHTGLTSPSYRSKWSKEEVPSIAFKEGRWGYSWKILRSSIMWPSFGNNEDLLELLPGYAAVFFGKPLLPDVHRIFDFSSEEDFSISNAFHYELYQDSNLLFETLDSQEFYSELFESLSMIEVEKQFNLKQDGQLTHNCESENE